MPVVEVDPEELRRLTGQPGKSDDELRSDLFALGLEYEGETGDGNFELEFGPDRLDRLSVEGIARSLRYQYGEDRGVDVPNLNDPEWTIEVDGTVPESRPYVTGAVVRGLDFDEDALDSLIQLQEKLHRTMGRDRAKGAIGIHDLSMLKGEVLTDTGVGDNVGAGDDVGAGGDVGVGGGGERRKSIRYTGVEPDGDRFVPLDSDREMTPGDVLAEHPVGGDYADLVAGYDRYPAIYDSIGLFSFPPVINGRRTELTTDSRDLFVELTGTDQWTIDRMCVIVCYALDARGGQVERVTVEYADDAPGDRPGDRLDRPDVAVREKTVAHERIESVLGIDLGTEEVLDLLERSGLSGDTAEEGDDEIVYDVRVPPYRVDVLHPLDIVDDVGRAYGFNELEPRYPDVSTVGGRHDRSRLEDAARDVLVGLGFEDLLNFHLVSETANYDRMNIERPSAAGPEAGAGDGTGDRSASGILGGSRPATITRPYSEDYEMVRTWALPSLLLVLENNTHRSYPQDLAEIGLAATLDRSENTHVAERRTVAAVLARTDATYEDAKARLQAVARAFGTDLATPATDHPTFIPGRAAEVVLDGDPAGVIGEVHPEVLVEHDLELPVAAFEFRLDALGE